MGTQRKIHLKGDGVFHESTGLGAILPGMLLDFDSVGRMIPHPTAGGRNTRMYAQEYNIAGKTIDETYASGDRVIAIVFQPGSEVHAAVPAGAPAIGVGDALESAGNGYVRGSTGAKATGQVNGQTNATGNLIFTARVAGGGGNAIKVIVNDAGTAGVTVSGETITITPGSGANTADAVKAQVEAVPGATALVDVTSGGTGEPGISTGIYLTGGSDPGAGRVGIAREALDNSLGASPKHIIMQVL
jgi:hypothetical protein